LLKKKKIENNSELTFKIKKMARVTAAQKAAAESNSKNEADEAQQAASSSANGSNRRW
jgi:hypothetical protein